MKLIQKRLLQLAAFTICVIGFSLAVAAQSTDQNFPTAITTNEINGTVRSRDIGDSRLTSYFYAFDGGQGDVFINVVTKNFNGDIDVFAADGLRPLTKIVVYSDAAENETGRLVYLRKPERLMLRVEGRSPNDDPANFRIKFAGSFIALAKQKEQEMPTIDRRDIDPSGVRVNSVGTIEVIPKPTPPETVSVVTSKTKKLEAANKEAAKPLESKPSSSAGTREKPTSKTVAAKNPSDKKSEDAAKKEAAPAKKPIKKDEVPEVKTVFKRSSKQKKETAVKIIPPPGPAKPDPMASVRLVVQLKGGKTIERPMNEITKFTVDKGVLTVIATDGSKIIYSMIDVAKVTIEPF